MEHRRKKQILRILRILEQADAQSIDVVCQEHNIPKDTFYRWKATYHHMTYEEVAAYECAQLERKLEQLERENVDLKEQIRLRELTTQ